MKTKKRIMQIFYIDKFGDECSIIQEMSKQSLGTWIWYFLDNGDLVTKVKEIR